VGAAKHWRPHLEQRWLSHLHVLEQASRYSFRSNISDDLRRLLEDDARRGWLQDKQIPNSHAQEREAIRLSVAAQAQIAAGRAPEALISLEHALAEASVDLLSKIAAAALELAWEADAKRDRDITLNAADLAVKAEPGSAGTWNYAGVLHSRLSNPERAVACYQEAVKLDTENGLFLCNLGTGFNQLKDYDKAEEFHRRALEINSNDAEAWRQLGNDYSWKNQFDKAEEFHRKALEINPNDAKAWQELGWDLVYRGKYGEAEDPFQRALSLDASDLNAQEGIGYLHLLRGEIETAEKTFQTVISGDGTRRNSYSLLACLNYRAGRIQEALTWAEQAVQREGKTPTAELTLLGLVGSTSERPAILEEAKRRGEGSLDLLHKAELLSLEE